LGGKDCLHALDRRRFVTRARCGFPAYHRRTDQNADDRNHDHQLDQRKAALVALSLEGSVHWKFLC
jgi:hypothetical protein